MPALVAQVDRQHGPFQPSEQARFALSRLEANIRASGDEVARGRTVTVTGNGFIPGRTPNGTTVVDGFGVFPPLPGQFGASTTGPFADPTSTVPGQTWDTVTATINGPRRDSPAAQLTLTGPDGNGTVTAAIDTKGMAPGTYTVTISGLLLTQTIRFEVR